MYSCSVWFNRLHRIVVVLTGVSDVGCRDIPASARELRGHAGSRRRVDNSVALSASCLRSNADESHVFTNLAIILPKSFNYKI